MCRFVVNAYRNKPRQHALAMVRIWVRSCAAVCTHAGSGVEHVVCKFVGGPRGRSICATADFYCGPDSSINLARISTGASLIVDRARRFTRVVLRLDVAVNGMGNFWTIHHCRGHDTVYHFSHWRIYCAKFFVARTTYSCCSSDAARFIVVALCNRKRLE